MMKLGCLVQVVLILLLLLPHSALAGTGIDYDDANCQGAWLMDADEDPLTDSSGDGNTMALKGAGEPNYATASPPKAYSTGYYTFDGNDDYTTTGSVYDDINLYPFTLSAWAYPTGDGVVIDFVDASATNIFYAIRVVDNFATIVARNVTYYSATDDADITGGWHHLAGVFISTVSKKLYVDGVEEAELTTSVTINTNTDQVDLGRFGDNSSSDWFNGSIDEGTFFDRTLTITEVNDIMDNGLAPSGAPATAFAQVISIIQ